MANERTRVDGGKELRNLFQELPKRVRSKGLRQAMTAASAPTVKATKADTPKQSGLLKKATTKKVKTYKGGDVVVAVIGANRSTEGEYRGKKRVPANYFHLVEEGHGHVAGRHMLQNAYDSTKEEAGTIALDKLKSVLESEAEKLGKK